MTDDRRAFANGDDRVRLIGGNAMERRSIREAV